MKRVISTLMLVAVLAMSAYAIVSKLGDLVVVHLDLNKAVKDGFKSIVTGEDYWK